MIKTIIDFLSFSYSLSGFLVALIVWTILAIKLSKSIKKHYKVYYWVVGSISGLNLLSTLSAVFGWGLPSITKTPIISDIFIEFGYAQYFIHPILVIIMYMGALSLKTRYVGQLMSIRKELSIIVGFPVLSHAIKRIIIVVPGSWKYFASPEMEASRNSGSTIMNAVYLLGILMTILFLILWVTSFDSVHKKMGSKRWKSLQRWSYALYAMLFIHAVGIDVGLMARTNARQKEQAKAQTEVVAGAAHSHGAQTAPAPSAAKSNSSSSHGRNSFSLATYKVSTPFKTIFNILLLVAIYGSYLILRIRKAKKDRLKKSKK